MFNLGLSELIVIGVIALIFIGPKQLPEVARVVGRLLNELRRATGDITGSFVQARNDADEAIRRTKQRIINDVSTSVSPNGNNQAGTQPSEESQVSSSSESEFSAAPPSKSEDPKS